MHARSYAFLFLPLVLWMLAGSAAPASAQTPEEEVRAVIDRLFDGMRAGDSTAVRAVFDATATMVNVGERDGAPMMQTGSLNRFVAAVGSPHEAIWDERVWDVKIFVDGNLASAWMNYAFFLGDQFSHCGVNALQLFRSPDGWKIVFLADTRRREGCNLPDWDE